MSEQQKSPTVVVTKDINAPISRVTVLEDRAQVRRSLKLDLPIGVYRLRVLDLSPVIADRSLNAQSGLGLRVDSLSVQRRWRIGHEESPPELGAQDETIKKLRHAIDELKAQRVLEKESYALLRSAARLYVDNINLQMPYAAEFDPQWAQELRSMLDEGGAIAEQLLLLNSKQFELNSQLEKAEDYRQHSLGYSPRQVLEAALVVEVEVLQEGPQSLALDYTVPCALWRPRHRATLVADGQVRFECEAALWQNTGEDWTEVALQFSTARSTQRAEPPILLDDVLRVRRKQERRVQVAIRQTQIANTGEGMGQETSLPGVDDGGETRLLDAVHASTVRSDGRMHRVPLFRFDTTATLERRCYPELAPLVHLQSKQQNRASQPLMAGPVDLLRDNGYVGSGELGFVAPGEQFVLGWGSDDALRVRREIDSQREQAKLTGKKTWTHDVRLYLSNLDAGEANFNLVERIPVSEIDKVQVRVDNKKTQPLVAPDANGLLSWPVTLKGHGTEHIRLSYQLIADGSVDGL